MVNIGFSNKPAHTEGRKHDRALESYLEGEIFLIKIVYIASIKGVKEPLALKEIALGERIRPQGLLKVYRESC